ncbi:MAG: hypothetical protein WBB01_06015 [Phormidesmis sp.]
MRLLTTLGGAIASLLLSTPLAVAQGIAQGDLEGCYIEWEDGVRDSLESLCDRPNPQAGSQSSSAVGDVPEGSAAATSPGPIIIRVISDVGSRVYANGVPSSIPGYVLPLPAGQNVDVFQPEYLQPNLPGRRYVSYQIFYPYPHLIRRRFGYSRRRAPIPEVTTPPTRPYYLNPDVPIPRIEERQQYGVGPAYDGTR